MPPKKNTSGLQAFNRARDAALKKKGIAGFSGLTAATRVEYAKPHHTKDFAGWNAARHTVLSNNGFRGGYAGLMTAAKKEHAATKTAAAKKH